MDELRDSQDGFCPLHDTHLDDGYCVACLVSRIGDLERREAALVAALRQADWALMHCEQLDDQSIYQARLEIAAALVAAPGGGEEA